MVKFVASIEQKADPVMDFVMCNLSAVTDTHIMHWTANTFSKHQALGAFYSGLEELIDSWLRHSWVRPVCLPHSPHNAP
jgi:hypothetical protein